MLINVSFESLILPFSVWQPSCGKVLNGMTSLDTETTIIGETSKLVLVVAFDGARGVFISPIHLEQFIKVHLDNEYVFHLSLIHI